MILSVFPCLNFVCAYPSYTIEQCLSGVEFFVQLLSSVPYPEEIFFTTFEVLLSHRYDINALDSNGLTCLDHAIKWFKSSKVQEFLRSHGASTTEELQQKRML